MATLNIKNMPEPLYRRLRARAKRERRSIAQEVIRILDDALSKPKSLSILELEGLGREVWHGVEAGVHVEAERRSWDSSHCARLDARARP